MNSDLKYKEAFEALLSYCNYQERCSSEVIQKLKDLELDSSKKEQILNDLIESNIVNDERFTAAFISGKVRIKRWGKNKIRAALRAKHISDNIIVLGFDDVIQADEYNDQLELLFTRKWSLLKNKKDHSTRGKIFRFLYGKGYESELINKLFVKYF